MRLLITLLISITLTCNLLHAQLGRKFKVAGAVYEDIMPLQGATVKLYKGNSVLETIKTSGNSRFQFTLEANNEYSIRISKDGYYTKRIDFNTSAPDDAILNFTTEFEVGLMKTCDGVDASILDKPIDIVRYNSNRQAFVSDEGHYQSMRNKLTQLTFDIEECFQDKYNDLLAESDQLLAEKKFDEALEKVEEARRLYPQDRAAKKKASTIEQAKKQDQQDDILFDKLIYAGDEALKSGNLEFAQKKYEEARALDPSASILNTKFQELSQIIELQKQETSNEKQYQSYLTQASKAETQKNFPLAKDYYQKAADIKPNDTYSQKKVSQMAPLIKQQEEEKKQKEQKALAYNDAISQGNAALQRNDFAAAKAAFEQAKSIDPTRPEASSKLNTAVLKIAQQKKADEAAKLAELQQKYDAAMAEGNSLIANEKYDEAIAAFQSARNLFPNNPEALRMINKTKNLKVEQQERLVAEKNTAYDKALAQGEEAKLNKDFEAAKAAFEKALSIKPNDRVALSKISETQKLIDDEVKAQKQLVELRNQYNNLISEADALFNSEQYEDAKSTYQRASALITSELYPKNQISKIDNLLAKLSIDAQFSSLIAQADNLVEQKNFDAAISTLQQAKNLKPESSLPAKKINDIKDLMNQIAKEELDAKFNSLISEAENLVANQQFEKAITVLQSAKGLKPESTLPDNKINEIKALQNNLANEEQNKKFNALIADADKLINEQQFEKASSILQSAKSIKPESDVPDQKLNYIKSLQNSIAKDKIEADYNAEITKADSYFDAQNYDLAIASYNKAKSIKPEESYPQSQINAINRIKSENMVKKIRDRYSALIAEANTAFDAGKYDEAKTLYTNAQQVLPEETYPRQRINEINGIFLKKEQEKELAIERENKYNSSIALADKYFEETNYPLARSEYQKALSIKSGEQYPLSQIDKINEREAQIKQQKAQLAEIDNQYSIAVQEADMAFKQNKYDIARQRYDDALKLKPAEIHPKEQIKRITQLIAEKEAREKALAEKENNYNSLIAEADNYYKSYKYSEAKSAYLKAMEVKPSEMYPQAMLRKVDDAMKLMANANQNSSRSTSSTNSTQTATETKKGTDGELQDLNFSSSSERDKYYKKLMEKYPSGVTKEIHKEKNKTTNRYVIIRNGEVTELREIKFSWGGSQFSRNGKPISVSYFRGQVKPQNGESYNEKVIEN